MTRQLRPVLLGGLRRRRRDARRRSSGGPAWLLGGFMLAIARRVPPLPRGGDARAGDRRDRVDPARRRLGRARARAHRAPARTPEDGRLAVFTVLLAVFAADTLAYFAGRLLGRHKLAPVISPGRPGRGSWPERSRRSRSPSSRSTRTGTSSSRSGRRSCSARVVALARGARRPVRVGVQARHAGEGHGPAARRPRRRARPRRLAPLRRAGGLLPPARLRTRVAVGHTHSVTRVALLGATGSIGRQALEVVAANPELELVRASSGSTPIDRARAADPGRRRSTELLERASPTSSSTRSSASRGIRATLWALERGVTLALANKESLVAAGELARRRGGGAGARMLPVDSEHRAAFQCLEGRAPEERGLARAHRVGRPVSRPYHARELARRHRRGRARAPDVVDGAEDHDRLRHAREQGPRGDRGALPLRPPVRPDRGRRPPDLDRPRARPLPRRRGARAPRPARHARADLVRPHLPASAPRRRCRRSTCAGLTLEFHEPDVETFPLLALAREAGEPRRHRPVRVQRRQRGRGRRVPRGAAAVPRRSPELVERALAAGRRSARRATSTSSSQADPARRRAAAEALVAA